MESSILPKVRYVRCPKCREILPEPVDVPFYKCGGCETILQAKHYKNPNERREMVLEASSTLQNNEVQNATQGGEASNSNSLLLTDSKEAINAEDGNQEQASSSSQPKPAPSSAECFLQQDEEAEQDIQLTDCSREGSSSNEPNSSSLDVASNRVPETGEEGGCKCADQRGDSLASSSNEAMQQVRQDEIVVEERLEAKDSRREAASADAKTDGEVDKLNKSVSLSCRLERPGVPDFTLLSNEPSLSESSNSSQVVAEEGSCTEVKDQPEQIELVLSNEPILGGDELCSHLGSLNEEVMQTEQHVVADGYWNTPASPNKSTFPQNKELTQLVAENQDIVEGGSLNDTDTSIEESLETQPAELDSKVLGVPDTVLLEPGKTSSLSAPDLYANSESQNSVIVDDATTDGNKTTPALPTLNPAVEEEEVLTLDDRSQKAAKINPIEEEIKEEKVTETLEVADAHFKAGISYKDLPKSSTRKSLAYDGSVSSCDGNDDHMVHQQLSESIQGKERTEIPAVERSTTCRGSIFQHKKTNLHFEEQTTRVMLNEIKMPEVKSDAPYRTSRARREFASRVPVYNTSPETQYESSDHLAHKEFYEHPMYYPPYRYRDVESRVTGGRVHRSDVDGRMISEAVWMGEEFHHMYPPYHESSGELYPYARHQMHYHGRNQTEYRPSAHRPYSGEIVRSGCRVVDSYSHIYPSEVRIGHYGPRKPYESYYTDSDYYARSRESSGDQRRTNGRMSRLQSRRNGKPVQHFQPIGGAAPFITCYQCSELLQLPCDFLVIKGIRVHRLKCSACSSILKFTLERSCHLVPYVPKSLNKSSTADHDYEALHRRSASASISPARIDQKVSLRSSSQDQERPKLHDKGKSVMHNHYNTAGSSYSPDMVPRNAKVTWRLPDRNNSPLHRLMGYSSPSAVLYGYGSDEIETLSQSRRGTTDFTPQSDNI